MTFKIVEETIKQAVLKSDIDRYLPVPSAKLKEIRKQLVDTGNAKALKTVSMLNQGLVYRLPAVLNQPRLTEFNTGADLNSSGSKLVTANVPRLQTSHTS